MNGTIIYRAVALAALAGVIAGCGGGGSTTPTTRQKTEAMVTSAVSNGGIGADLVDAIEALLQQFAGNVARTAGLPGSGRSGGTLPGGGTWELTVETDRSFALVLSSMPGDVGATFTALVPETSPPTPTQPATITTWPYTGSVTYPGGTIDVSAANLIQDDRESPGVVADDLCRCEGSFETTRSRQAVISGNYWAEADARDGTTTSSFTAAGTEVDVTIQQDGSSEMHISDQATGLFMTIDWETRSGSLYTEQQYLGSVTIDDQGRPTIIFEGDPNNPLVLQADLRTLL